MEISSEPADAIARHAAQRAARAAAGAFSQTTPIKTTHFSNYAIYAWAFVAFMGTAVAGSALLGPTQNQQIAGMPAVDKFVTASLDTDDQPAKTNPMTMDPSVVNSSNGHPFEDEQSIGEHADPFPAPAANAIEMTDLRSGLPTTHSTAGSAAIIGPPTDIRSLLLRYVSLKQKQPLLLSTLVPKVQFLDESDNPMTNLIAGPFADKAERDLFCDRLSKHILMSCRAAYYTGIPLLGE